MEPPSTNSVPTVAMRLPADVVRRAGALAPQLAQVSASAVVRFALSIGMAKLEEMVVSRESLPAEAGE